MKTANITDTIAQVRSIKRLAQTKLETLKDLKDSMRVIVERANPALVISDEVFKVRTFSKFVDELESLHVSLLAQKDKIILERKKARLQKFYDLKVGTYLKLDSGLKVQVISKDDNLLNFNVKSIDDESLTYELGETITGLTVFTLSKAKIMTKRDLNTKYAVATLNTKSFQYEITLTTDDKEKAQAANINDHTFMMREFKQLGLSINEQLQDRNNALKDISLKCNVINKCRKAALKAHKLITEWYVTNKDKLQYKDDGSLYKKWADSLKSELAKISDDNKLQVRYEWDYSLRIEIKADTQLTNGSTLYKRENVYVCNADGTLCDLDNQANFKTVSPLRYFNALNELSTIDSKIETLKSEKLKLKNLISE